MTLVALELLTRPPATDVTSEADGLPALDPNAGTAAIG
jgi:hypothetical protein